MNLTKSELWSNSGLHSEECQCKEAATWINVHHTAEMMWGKASLLRHNPEIYLKVVNKTKATFVALVHCCSDIRHPDSHTRGQTEISRLRDSVYPKYEYINVVLVFMHYDKKSVGRDPHILHLFIC